MTSQAGPRGLQISSNNNLGYTHLYSLSNLPINVDEVKKALVNYLHQDFAMDLIQGLEFGFKLKYSGPRLPLEINSKEIDGKRATIAKEKFGKKLKLGCCTPNKDLNQYKEYQRIRDIIGKTSNLWNKCSKIVEELLCQQCSPYAAHIYDAEATFNPRDFPGLCKPYCEHFYDNCRGLLQYMSKDQNLLQAASKNRTFFCQQTELVDKDYCYPELLSNDVLNNKISVKQVTSPGCICMEELAEKLKNPVFVRNANDGTNRLFVGEVSGYIHIYYPNGRRLQNLFLDISSRTLNTENNGDERGLLGLAFHPDFKYNQRFFLYYSTFNNKLDSNNHLVRISEFRISNNDPNIGNVSSERVLLEIPQPYWNHNGGEIMFGDEGYLYLFVGDGGSGGDPQGFSQNTSSILGKVLRLDINTEAHGPNIAYKIPADNPFVGTPNFRPEIYAYGVRNIWRCGKDRGDPVTGYGKGRIMCGDVGQNAHEEVDLLQKGGNYGWNSREGFACFNEDCGKIGPEILPVYSYPHATGKSVTGGHFYRGCLNPNLNGLYIFGDFMNGKLFSLEENITSSTWNGKQITTCGPEVCVPPLTGKYEPNIISFGEDESGELYMVSTGFPSSASAKGKLYRIIDPARRGNPENCEAARDQTDLKTLTTGNRKRTKKYRRKYQRRIQRQKKKKKKTKRKFRNPRNKNKNLSEIQKS
ncbi:HHIP-like protein 1,HHIP-like protein 2 [Mytilus coruscus]|uniref:HHIP-like protein 1,HHIP-like protein 2 n=1 Tax=Mytilus coruscus TaxID=42192 RepID=A0A6J8A454_MYTCO|nr:HHIP-like protein 1,HHIP-like protein 2 [Mytilus coruscus]